MGLQKKLLSGLFWVVLLNLMIKPFWILGIERGVQNAVGATEYGLYFALFNISYIFNILLDMGVTNFNTRNIAQHPELITKHLQKILPLKLALVGLYVMVTFGMGLLRGFSSREFALLAVLCLNQFLNSMILYLRSNFEGLLLFKWDSVLSILDRALMILICGALLIGFDSFQIEWFAWAQTAAYLATLLLALAVLWHKTGFCRPKRDVEFSRDILRQSLPFALLVLLMASYNRIDPVLLQWMLEDGDFQSGIYAGAFRLLDALTMIAYLVSVPLLPIFSKLTAQADEPSRNREVAQITRLVFSLMMVFSIGAAVTFSMMAEPLMDLMYTDHVKESSQVFRILIYGIIPISFTYIFGTLLTANGSLRQLNLMALTALLANVAVNMLLIPRLGAVGSAWASLSAQALMAVAQLWLALKIFGMRPKMGYLAQLIAFIGVIIAINYVCCCGGMEWWAQMLAAVVVALAAGFVLRLIDIRQLLTILKEN